MSSLKEQQQAQRSLQHQQQVIEELSAVVKDIERCEKTALELQTELAAANAQYPSPRSTRQDIAYLTELLKCANKKLVWEKLMLSLQKRMPRLMEQLTRIMEDPKNPPPESTRDELLKALKGIQAAMERLQGAKLA